MSVWIENEVEFKSDFNVEELVKSVVNACLEYEECPYEASVNITFTDNEGIHQLNREYRETDRETDVLSFPMVEYETAGDFSFLDENEDSVYECFDPDSGELILGDIVISMEKAREQAEEYGHSFKREIAFLTAHSMFHLFGYDHMDDDEREVMEKKQREVLGKLEINR